MRNLVVGTFLTLDGVMQAPGGPDEDRDGGFQHGGWLVPYLDEEIVRIMTEWTRRADAFLLGRKTYEIFAGSWPRSTDPADEIAVALNTRPKFVASSLLKKVDWSNSTLLQGDVAEQVAKLKAQEGGEIQVHGSGDLLQTLLEHDLVDALRIWQFPVVLGTGKRLSEKTIAHFRKRLASRRSRYTAAAQPRGFRSTRGVVASRAAAASRLGGEIDGSRPR
jgi:dihydrofolate reductase